MILHLFGEREGRGKERETEIKEREGEVERKK